MARHLPQTDAIASLRLGFAKCVVGVGVGDNAIEAPGKKKPPEGGLKSPHRDIVGDDRNSSRRLFRGMEPPGLEL